MSARRAGGRARRGGAGRAGRVLRQHAGAALRPVGPAGLRAAAGAGARRRRWRPSHQARCRSSWWWTRWRRRGRWSRNPLFQVMVVLQNHALGASGAAGRWRASALPLDPGVAKFDLAFEFAERRRTGPAGWTAGSTTPPTCSSGDRARPGRPAGAAAGGGRGRPRAAGRPAGAAGAARSAAGWSRSPTPVPRRCPAGRWSSCFEAQADGRPAPRRWCRATSG